MTWRRLVPLTAAVAVAVAVVGYAVDGRMAGSDTAVLGPGEVVVELDIEHSRFGFDRLDVAQGSVVRFVVRNGDPIAHELIVGDAAVHRRHREGTEAVHPPVPGEVSVGPDATASTVYVFDEAGTVEFACHLPGHLDYGMRGEVQVHAG